MSHLARAQNFKTNCYLFTFNNVYFRSSAFKYPIEKKINKRKIKNKKAHTVSVNIAAWNIRSLNYSREEDYSTLKCTPNDKRLLLVKEAKRLHLDVLCLSETRLLVKSVRTISKSMAIFWFGQVRKTYINLEWPSYLNKNTRGKKWKSSASLTEL